MANATDENVETVKPTGTAPRADKWASIGIEWYDAEVKTNVDTPAERTHRATMPRIVDIDKFIDGLGKARATALLNNSNSMTVAAQGKNRDAATAKDGPHGFEWVRDSMWRWFNGLRSSAIVLTPNVFPDGTKYEGADETEFRQGWVLRLTEMGVPTDIAIEKSKLVKWNAR
jgi:hypothetical protein